MKAVEFASSSLLVLFLFSIHRRELDLKPFLRNSYTLGLLSAGSATICLKILPQVAYAIFDSKRIAEAEYKAGKASRNDLAEAINSAKVKVISALSEIEKSEEDRVLRQQFDRIKECIEKLQGKLCEGIGLLETFKNLQEAKKQAKNAPIDPFPEYQALQFSVKSKKSEFDLLFDATPKPDNETFQLYLQASNDQKEVERKMINLRPLFQALEVAKEELENAKAAFKKIDDQFMLPNGRLVKALSKA